MARPEKPISTGISELARFAEALRELRRSVGKSYTELEAESGYRASVLSRAASGNALPTWPVTESFVRACAGDTQHWEKAWRRAKEAVDRHRSTLLASGDASTEPGRPPENALQFNRAVQARLRRSGLTQRETAARIGCSPSALSAALQGDSLLTVEMLTAIIAAAAVDDAEVAMWWAARTRIEDVADAPTGADPRDASTARTSSLKRSRHGKVIAAALGALVAVLVVAATCANGPEDPEPGHPVAESAPPVSEVVTGARAGEPSRSPSSPARPVETDRPSSPALPVERGNLTAGDPEPVDSRPPVRVAPGRSAAPPKPMRTALPAGVDARINSTIKAITGLSADGAVMRGDLQPGRLVKISCLSTTAATEGWYYTAGGFWMRPADVTVVDDEERLIPDCSDIPFPERGHRIAVPSESGAFVLIDLTGWPADLLAETFASLKAGVVGLLGRLLSGLGRGLGNVESRPH